jgi:hypothetical protein
MLFPVVLLGNETALMGGTLHGRERESAALDQMNAITSSNSLSSMLGSTAFICPSVSYERHARAFMGGTTGVHSDFALIVYCAGTISNNRPEVPREFSSRTLPLF